MPKRSTCRQNLKLFRHLLSFHLIPQELTDLAYSLTRFLRVVRNNVRPGGVLIPVLMRQHNPNIFGEVQSRISFTFRIRSGNIFDSLHIGVVCPDYGRV